MTTPLFTRKDVHLCEALASLAEHSEDRKRAGHLPRAARELGARIAEVCEAIPLEAMDMTPDDVVV